MSESRDADGFHHFRIVNAFSVAKANGTGNEQAWIVSLESHANHISGKPPSKERGVGFNLPQSDRLIIRLLLYKAQLFHRKRMKTDPWVSTFFLFTKYLF